MARQDMSDSSREIAYALFSTTAAVTERRRWLGLWISKTYSTVLYVPSLPNWDDGPSLTSAEVERAIQGGGDDALSVWGGSSLTVEINDGVYENMQLDLMRSTPL